MTTTIRRVAGLCGLVLLSVLSCEAFAHAERATFFPEKDVRAKAHPVYRPLLSNGQPSPQSNRLVVCKKPGDEGVAQGDDSAARIARMAGGALKQVNQTLYGECRFPHLQAAVDAVKTAGTTIYVLPGLYREQPSIRALEENYGARVAADRSYCQAVVARGPGQLSYQEQYRCPHIQNTVAIFGDPDYADDNCGSARDGKCAGDPKTLTCRSGACQYYNLQIEGTGARVSDVIFEGDFINKAGDAADGRFRYLNGIRGDRADGLYLRNFTTQIFEFNAVYVVETDGYVFDRLLSRWVDEYAFLSFASDHGLYDYTEGYGVADSVQYPGSGADIYPDRTHAGVGDAGLRARQATEIRNSKGHHSALGYSGTAGNAPWVHDNEFYKNQSGMATESLFGGHPGMPQDHGLFENNKIYSNNKDYYKLVAADGPCITKTPRDRGVVPPEFRYFDRLPADHQEAIMDRTVVCPPIPFPTGTGMVIAGGNYNIVQRNQVWDNWRQGYWFVSMPTLVHAINDPYADKIIPKGVMDQLPAEVRGTLGAGNDVLSAAGQQLSDPATLRLLLTQPIYASHYNRFLDNQFGISGLTATQGRKQPNGVDFYWDKAGKGNCWSGNTSNAGAVTSESDVGLPADCIDGQSSNEIDQLTTAWPPRIVPFVPCLTYSRNDPSSKSGCPFFTDIAPPAGREGRVFVTSDEPSDGSLVVNGVTQLGYFVLHNDSNAHQQLKAVVVNVSAGKAATLGGARLVVNGVQSGAGQVSGDSVRFAFAAPAQVNRGEATLVELVEGQATTAYSQAADGRWLASLGIGGAAGLLMVIGGFSRRQRWLGAGLLLALALLHGCGGDGGGAASEAVAPRVNSGNTMISLASLEFVNAADAAGYAGLPKLIGQVNR